MGSAWLQGFSRGMNEEGLKYHDVIPDLISKVMWGTVTFVVWNTNNAMAWEKLSNYLTILVVFLVIFVLFFLFLFSYLPTLALCVIRSVYSSYLFHCNGYTFFYLIQPTSSRPHVRKGRHNLKIKFNARISRLEQYQSFPELISSKTKHRRRHGIVNKAMRKPCGSVLLLFGYNFSVANTRNF